MDTKPRSGRRGAGGDDAVQCSGRIISRMPRNGLRIEAFNDNEFISTGDRACGGGRATYAALDVLREAAQLIRISIRGSPLTRIMSGARMPIRRPRWLWRIIYCPSEMHNPMELHVATAFWDGEDKVTVYTKVAGDDEIAAFDREYLWPGLKNVQINSRFLWGCL